MVGAGFAMTDLVSEATETVKAARNIALVTTPYFVGGICVTLGTYSSILKVVNIPHRDANMSLFFTGAKQWRILQHYSSTINLVGVIANFAGAFLFNITTVVSYFSGPNVLLISCPAILGGLCFFVGGAIEMYENRNATDAAWWISSLNCCGGFCFTLAGLAGSFPHLGEMTSFFINFTYFLGALFFFVGGVVGLWMWKNEQFGLAWVKSINTRPVQVDVDDEVLEMQAEYGCGKASSWQLPFILLYMLNAAGSVLNFSLRATPGCLEINIPLLTTVSLHFMLSHGVLLLTSVVHHIPTARPFNWLIIYMRLFMCLYTVDQISGVIMSISELSEG